MFNIFNKAKTSKKIIEIKNESLEIKEEIEDFGYGIKIIPKEKEYDPDTFVCFYTNKEKTSYKTCKFENRFSFIVVEKYFEDMETCRKLYSHMYKSKAYFGNEANQIIGLCIKNIELKPVVDSYFKIEYEDDATPRNPHFDTLRKLYTYRKEYSEALKYLELERESGQIVANYDSLKSKLLKKIM